MAYLYLLSEMHLAFYSEDDVLTYKMINHSDDINDQIIQNWLITQASSPRVQSTVIDTLNICTLPRIVERQWKR